MRLTDFLRGPASRQVQYFPDLVPILGSVTATILFGQLLYWADKGSDPEGWIYKSQAEIATETALTREEQECARKKLRDVGILKEKKKGIPCRLWFLLDLNKVNELWEKSQQYSQNEGKPQTSMRDSRKQVGGIPANKSEGFPQATTIDYPADDAEKNNSSRSASPAAALSPAARPPQKQTLSPEVEAAIQALPIEHQADARQVCEEEEATDQAKLDAINLFGKKLVKGKAEGGGWLRKAVKGDWGAKERIKQQQKAERQEQDEVNKRAEAERQAAAAEEVQKKLLARQKRFFSLPEPERQMLEDQARRWLAEWGRPNPDYHGLISAALDILDGLIIPQPQGPSSSLC